MENHQTLRSRLESGSWLHPEQHYRRTRPRITRPRSIWQANSTYLGWKCNKKIDMKHKRIGCNYPGLMASARACLGRLLEYWHIFCPLLGFGDEDRKLGDGVQGLPPPPPPQLQQSFVHVCWQTVPDKRRVWDCECPTGGGFRAP